jgi:xanthine dehydrogenase YagR molybdenum-binding subunit
MMPYADEKLAFRTGSTDIVGKPLPRVDAYERVSGSAIYSGDVMLPGMLHAAILRCPYAHALVKRIDSSVAEKLPGVRAMLSSFDPEAKIPLPYPWWVPKGPPMLLFDPHCRYAGEEVAGVAAESQAQAWNALRAIKVSYEKLPFISDAEDATKPGAARIHDGGNLVRPVEISERGDLAKGFADADAIVEQTFRTSAQIHTPIEPHVAVADWNANRLTVWAPTQAIFNEQKQIATALNLPLSSVRVISHYVGGSFGSKAELSKHTLIAAILSRKTSRPVKLALIREETFLCVGHRPSNKIEIKAGAKKDGTLTALSFTNIGSTGAYADWADAGGGTSLYACPNVRVQETETYTNVGKTRAFRGPGEVQCFWALEQTMDELANRIGMDPVEFRLKNPIALDQFSHNQYTSNGLAECLKKGAEAFGWQQVRARARSSGPIRRGVGVAACCWSVSGGPPTTVIVTLLADGSVTLNMAAADQGTGTKTSTAMIVAEELGVPLEKITIEQGDTGTTQYGKPGGGSHSLVVYGPAVLAAAADVKRQLIEMASADLKVPASELSLKDGKITSVNATFEPVPLSKVKGVAQRQAIIGIGQPPPDPEKKIIISFGAQFAEVEVNTRTGEIRVVRLVAAHDSGRVVNPIVYESQIFGGMVMAMGFALTEKAVIDKNGTGTVVNANWHDYKIPTAKDVPLEQTCIAVDPGDTECNTLGVKGLGELGTMPTAPAIANAIYNATGIRVTDAPITPMQMVKLLAGKNKRA